ncbi:hypothetical protein [Burkholderia lata]|nr:hypothetical protein [Burkholderia lata]
MARPLVHRDDRATVVSGPHCPAITHDIPRVLAGAIAHCEAAAA